MAASPTPGPSADATLRAALAAAGCRPPLAVALSGGADSTALLLSAAAQWPGAVQAIHVHHGLQPAADGFEQFCRDICQRLNVPLSVLRVQVARHRGDSVEQQARLARYCALARQAQVLLCREVLLAQHADDQVETVLLALSRGAGLPGLAGMAAQFQRAGMVFRRPWLGLPGRLTRQALRERGQTWVEDPSNGDCQRTRNRIRHAVLPALYAAFPDLPRTLARSAAHAAQAQILLREMALQDLATTGRPPGIAALQSLSDPRCANLLRLWLLDDHGTTPSTAQMQALLVQLRACTTRGHRIDLRVGRGRLQRDGARLRYTPDL